MTMPATRRRALLVAAVVWVGLGVALVSLAGGAGGFSPDDPTVPRIGFVGLADGKVGLVIGPESFAAAQAVEVRTGSQAQSGRMLWRVERQRAEDAPDGPVDGVIVVGEAPDGFDETDPFVADLPTTWHAEIDNRCFLGSAVAPDGASTGSLATDVVTMADGERITPDSFRAADQGFSECGSSSLGERAAAYIGLISIAIGGVLLVGCWWDWRRGLPAELGS